MIDLVIAGSIALGYHQDTFRGEKGYFGRIGGTCRSGGLNFSPKWE